MRPAALLYFKIAPSNSSVFYMTCTLGMMYKTVNKGVTFVNQTTNVGGTPPKQTLVRPNSKSPQDNGFGYGPCMAIDPQNPNI